MILNKYITTNNFHGNRGRWLAGMELGSQLPYNWIMNFDKTTPQHWLEILNKLRMRLDIWIHLSQKKLKKMSHWGWEQGVFNFSGSQSFPLLWWFNFNWSMGRDAGDITFLSLKIYTMSDVKKWHTLLPANPHKHFLIFFL